MHNTRYYRFHCVFDCLAVFPRLHGLFDLNLFCLYNNLVAFLRRATENQLYLGETNFTEEGWPAVPGRHLLGSLNGPELHVEARVPEHVIPRFGRGSGQEIRRGWVLAAVPEYVGKGGGRAALRTVLAKEVGVYVTVYLRARERMGLKAAPNDLLGFREFGVRWRFCLASEAAVLRDFVIRGQRLAGALLGIRGTTRRSVDESSSLPVGGLVSRVARVCRDPN